MSSCGRTYIALIPNKDNPRLVYDFRPIYLCNVCFKIISKILANHLKHVLPHLIGREQAGFIVDRCPFDNIITLQEIVHSVERELKSPSRMLVKIDVEKAYDTLSWTAILVIFTKMNFPNTWISCSRTCLSSNSFSLLKKKVPFLSRARLWNHLNCLDSREALRPTSSMRVSSWNRLAGVDVLDWCYLGMCGRLNLRNRWIGFGEAVKNASVDAESKAWKSVGHNPVRALPSRHQLMVILFFNS